MDTLLRDGSDTLVLCDRDGTIRDAERDCLLPGVVELFEGLREKNVVIAIVTAGENEPTENFLDSVGLRDLVSLIVADVNETGRCRIALDRVEKATRMKFDPKNVFVLDDDYGILRQADALGLKAIGVATGYSALSQLQELRPKPHAVFEDLRDTRAVLGAILGKDRVEKPANGPKLKSA